MNSVEAFQKTTSSTQLLTVGSPELSRSDPLEQSVSRGFYGKPLYILEDTLRDGLYIIDFLIEPLTIRNIATNLLNIGFEDIEVGHGLGLGAYKSHSCGFSDGELLEALSDLLPNNRFFFFYIPSLCGIDNIAVAKEFGVYGIRVGVDANDLEKYAPQIEEVKKAGFFTTLNVMKSYAIKPNRLAELVGRFCGIADVLYVVDSAGFMLPEDVKGYINSLRDRYGEAFEIGFHGHNNLNLAISNALAAIKSGATYIDTTLGGIGRSGGNIPTEAFVAIMMKMGLKSNDPSGFLELLKIVKSFRAYLASKGRCFVTKEEDTLYGFVGFHSGFEEGVMEFAKKHGVDFGEFLLKLCEHEKINIKEDTLNRVLREGFFVN